MCLLLLETFVQHNFMRIAGNEDVSDLTDKCPSVRKHSDLGTPTWLSQYAQVCKVIV